MFFPDVCHDFAWCLDACVRDKHLDAQQTTKLKNILESAKKLPTEVREAYESVHFQCYKNYSYFILFTFIYFYLLVILMIVMLFYVISEKITFLYGIISLHFAFCMAHIIRLDIAYLLRVLTDTFEAFPNSFPHSPKIESDPYQRFKIQSMLHRIASCIN